MGETSVLHWEWPDLTDVADAPDWFWRMAVDIETTMADKTMTPFVPRWVATGTYQPTNPIVNVGFCRVNRGLCDVAIYQAYGPATSGGSGDLAIELPVWTSWAPEQWLTAKAYVPGYGKAVGLGIVIGARQVIQPVFPAAASVIGLQRWRSTVDPIAPGTGIPVVAGAYTISDTGNLAITGRYRIAA